MRDFRPVSAAPPESVHVLRDPESGLDGVIVIHSSRRGPAAGGCRLWRYASSAEMARDAARLAEGMAYKNALADLPLGGGKAVLNLPAEPFDRRRLFAAFASEVNKLEGTYVTAEDVGTTVADMHQVRRSCRHVAGLTAAEGRAGGDPSPWTALGVFLAMREAARRKFGADLRGMTVAVQGSAASARSSAACCTRRAPGWSSPSRGRRSPLRSPAGSAPRWPGSTRSSRRNARSSRRARSAR